jgi:hypothetical protein
MRIFITIELLYGSFSSLNIYDVGDKILLLTHIKNVHHHIHEINHHDPLMISQQASMHLLIVNEQQTC